MLTNKIWLRKTIVCLKSVLLIHHKWSPFPSGEGIDKSQFHGYTLISNLIKLVGVDVPTTRNQRKPTFHLPDKFQFNGYIRL